MSPDSDIQPSVLGSLERHGPASGVPVLMVHGSMDRQAAFARTIRLLPDISAYVFDRRGYARSGAVGPPFTVDANADDLIAVIETIGRPIRVVGHSFGGVVVLAAACRRPDLFVSIAVYESPMSWREWWPNNTGGARAAANEDGPEAAAEAFLKRFIGEDRWNRLPERTRAARRAEGRALVGEMIDLRRGAPYELTELAVPVLSSFGSKASTHVRKGAEELALSTSRLLVEIEGARHDAPSSSPTDFAEKVIRPLLKLGS